jgi:predicted TPR repeat methyltransferase
MGVSKKWHIGRSRAKAFLDEAYALESEAEAIAFYDRWAEEYDAQVERGLRYVAPRELAETLSRYHAPCDVPVLDVGCGTGLTGSCLRELGFSTIDGLDLSTAMLEKAREKGVYRSLMAADLNAPLALDDGAYGAVVCSGTFTQGHVGPGPIDELLRVLGPGGFFACTVHGKVWEAMGFAAKFSELLEGGTLRSLEQRLSEYFEGQEKIAWYCVFQKI